MWDLSWKVYVIKYKYGSCFQCSLRALYCFILFPLHDFFNMKKYAWYLLLLFQYKDQIGYLYFTLLKLTKHKMVANTIFISHKINYWNDFHLGARFMNGMF